MSKIIKPFIFFIIRVSLFLVTIQPITRGCPKKKYPFHGVALMYCMKIESYFPLKWFQYFR